MARHTIIGITALLIGTASGADTVNDSAISSSFEGMMLADTIGMDHRQERRQDNRQERREDYDVVDNMDDRHEGRQDCRQEEGIVGHDKRDCKQEARQDNREDKWD